MRAFDQVVRLTIMAEVVIGDAAVFGVIEYIANGARVE